MLRIGLFADSGVVAPHIYDFAKWSSQESGIENCALILSGGKERNPEAGVSFAFRFMEAIEAQLLSLVYRAKGEGSGRRFFTFDASPLFNCVLSVHCRASTGDVLQQIAPDDIARIKELNLDLIVSVCDRADRKSVV